MKITVTGGLGHIGSSLIRSNLESLGVKEVVVVDSLSTQRFSSLFNLSEIPRITFINQSIELLNESELKIIEGSTALIHLAAMTDASGSVNKKDELFANNLGGTQFVANLCKSKGIKLLFPSSTSVYGSQSSLVDESSLELNPQSPYADCKLAEEALIQDLVTSGMSGVILRLGTIHGVSPGMRFHTAVNKFCFDYMLDKPLSVWRTAINQYRPYLALSDAVRAIHHAIGKDIFDGEIYNVLTENISLETIISVIEETGGKPARIEYVDNPIMNQFSYEVSKIKFERTGFDYQGSIREDIANTLKILGGIQNVRL
jgi:nucleoside-diphosphate-sugar epimerase